jgi:hypothetical protein
MGRWDWGREEVEGNEEEEKVVMLLQEKDGWPTHTHTKCPHHTQPHTPTTITAPHAPCPFLASFRPAPAGAVHRGAVLCPFAAKQGPSWRPWPAISPLGGGWG